jgi:23S rRNA (guanosine2251-2'-O)-methyltransferase
MEDSPRRRFITIYGRMPVLEALADERVTIDKVVLATGSRGHHVDDIVAGVRARGIRLEWGSAQKVTRISRNGRHDQGVVADVRVAGMAELEAWLAVGAGSRVGGVDVAGATAGPLLVLDGLTNPANVGMIIRVATAAGMAGTVVPRFGCADLGPLVVKASAGTAFRATILGTDTATEAVERLVAAGYTVYGLRGDAPGSLYDTTIAEPAAFVLGNETEGISAPAAALVTHWLSLPMAGGVESLNVATAAGVVAYELARRQRVAQTQTQLAVKPH